MGSVNRGLLGWKESMCGLGDCIAIDKKYLRDYGSCEKKEKVSIRLQCKVP